MVQIATRKDVRPRGPSGFAIWGGVFLMSAFGFWSVSSNFCIASVNCLLTMLFCFNNS